MSLYGTPLTIVEVYAIALMYNQSEYEAILKRKTIVVCGYELHINNYTSSGGHSANAHFRDLSTAPIYPIEEVSVCLTEAW